MGAALPSGGSGGGRRGRRRAGARPMAEINVTPFVDVMLVLLIIFMVAAPLLTSGVPVELPETSAEALPQEQEDPLTIQLAADGSVYLGANKTAVEEDRLEAKLKAIAAERDDDRVYLRADKALSYERVMVVMSALRQSGFRSISLVTDQPVPARS